MVALNAVGADEMRTALTRASQVGAYFAVETPEDALLPGAEADGQAPVTRWRPLRELVDDADVLTERVTFARDFLIERTGGDVELRACASINSLGVMSRLVAPALATACRDGVVPDLGPDDVWWRALDGGPLPVAFGDVAGRRVADAVTAADVIVESVIEPVVRPVLEAYRGRFGLSPQTLWGNLASALNGAAGMLPDTIIDPHDLIAAALTRTPLSGSGHHETFAGRRHFVRDNCCLFYRVPAGGKCGDCVLVPEAARHDMWRTASAR